MGYGHQRTAYPLKDLSPDNKIINANDYNNIPDKDRRIWENSRRFYEFISNFRKIPLIGNLAFSIFDTFQKILKFYPRRDFSQPNFVLKQIYSLIKKGWGGDLIQKLKVNPIPLISTFFTPAFMADCCHYPSEIFCVVCDADIARTWVPLEPKLSKIKYFAPNERVVERLKLYGIKPENIFLTGYPLPLKNIGNEKMEILKEDLRNRILNLDPHKNYLEKYQPLIQENLGNLPKKSNHPLTLMFSIGGAGAQKEIAAKVIRSLAEKIKKDEIKLVLAIGLKKRVKEYFEKIIKSLGLQNHLDKNLELVSGKEINDYFKNFNQALRKADVLWTKPSELSFYTALGLPIIIAPTIGSQEEFNQDWLLKLGSGMIQENPAYTHEWLFDFLDAGWFAEAAMQGFIEGEKMGTYNIKRIISSDTWRVD